VPSRRMVMVASRAMRSRPRKMYTQACESAICSPHKSASSAKNSVLSSYSMTLEHVPPGLNREGFTWSGLFAAAEDDVGDIS
jgi:hypothetical protein